MMAGYDIDFTTIIQNEIHERAFGETMTLPFPCLIQRFYSKASVLKVSIVDDRVQIMTITHTRLMKDSAQSDLYKRPCKPIILLWPSMRAH